jgi:hypothetical protein
MDPVNRTPISFLSLVLVSLASACSGAPEQGPSKEQQEAAPATEALTGGGASVVDMQKAREELIRLEHTYAKALIAKDRAFLESYYAADFRGGNWMGFWTKSTMLKAILDDRYSIRSMSLSNIEVKITGTIGIVQGVSTEVTRVNGDDTSGRWTFTDVFELRGGRWLAVASHTSELKPGAAT